MGPEERPRRARRTCTIALVTWQNWGTGSDVPSPTGRPGSRSCRPRKPAGKSHLMSSQRGFSG